MLSLSRMKTLTDVSKHSSLLVAELEGEVFPYAAGKKMHKKVLAEMKPYASNLEKLPFESQEELADVVISQTIMARIFSQPARIASVRKILREALSRETLKYLRWAVDHPWYMTGFYVLDKEGPHILRILDYHDGQEYLLYSPAVEDIWLKGKNSLYTLFYFNGECLQTYGGIYYLQWANQDDFLYFARRLAQYIFDQVGLRGVMTQHTVEWIALFSMGEFPVISHRGADMEACRSVVKVSNFFPDQLLEEAQIDEAGGNIRALLDPEDPMSGPRVIWEERKKQLHLSAMTEERYLLGRERLQEIAEFPAEPDERCSATMIAAAEVILGPDEFFALDASFKKDVELKPEDQIELNRLNDLVERLNAAHNTGREVSTEQLAEETGLSEETVIHVRGELEKIIQRNTSFQDGFLGFSPEQMHTVIHNTFDNIPDIVEIRPDRIEPEEVVKSLWTALALELMHLVEDAGGTLKATARGNLPRKAVEHLYQKELSLWEDAGRSNIRQILKNFTVRGEQDAYMIHTVKTFLQLSGYLREVPGAFTLTGKSQPLPSGPLLIDLYLDLFHCASRECFLKYPRYMQPSPFLRQALPFILYALSREPEGRFTGRRLTEIVQKAFPEIEKRFSKEEESVPYQDLLEILVTTQVINQ